MKLAILIVNYNVKYYLEQCLNSVLKSIKNIDAEIFVVDNHSRDGSIEYLEKKFPQVKFVASQHNLGFSRANNLILREVECEYALLLNPDTIVGENTIREVLEFMDAHPKAGGAGVRMLKANGENAMESRRGLPTLQTSFYKMCGLTGKYPTHKRFGRYYMGYLPWTEPAKIEVMSGAFCILRKTALDKIGLLDEDFFMYGEDIDISYRLLKGGFENWFIPTSILHYKGESTHRSSFRYVHVFYQAMLIFFKKHYKNYQIWLTGIIKMAIYLKATLALLKMLSEKVNASLGLTKQNKMMQADFIFIGTVEMLEKCRKLVAQKGLSALEFIEGTEESLPQGHQGMDIQTPPNAVTYVVYDTEAFSYDKIFACFAQQPQKDVEMATYSLKTEVLITLAEIIK